MTRYGAPLGIVPTSNTRATCSLRMRAAARPSCRKRPTTSLLASASGKRNLIATCSPSCLCRAATTTPIPPRPRKLDPIFLGQRVADLDATVVGVLHGRVLYVVVHAG